MTSNDLFYPDIKAEIGNYILTEGITTEVYSSDKSYFDWAKIRFTEEYEDAISVSENDPAIIQLGYNGVFEDVFTGYVAKNYNGSTYLNEILLKDDMLLLEKVIINNTFLEVTPQEIIKYGLAKAGISSYKILTDTFAAKARVPIYKKNMIAVLNEINALWSISKKFFFADGTFYWGTAPEQTKVYEFKYSVNIISLTKENGLWKLETVSAPFIKHSHQIKVTHPKITGTYDVTKVVFKTNDSGYIRTYIYF